MEPNNEIVSNAIAQTAVKLCRVAVDTNPSSQLNNLLPKWKIVWSGDTTLPNYAFVAVDPTGQTYALAIRGSVNPKVFGSIDGFVDWILEDLDIALAYWPFTSGDYSLSTNPPCVSAGGYTAFTSLLQMQDTLGSKRSIADYLLTNTANKQVIITGHSLGGNVANLYASYYAEMLKKNNKSTRNLSLYTFAAPASGNSLFSFDLDSKIISVAHYQNTNDIVPNFPTVQGFEDTAKLYNPIPDASKVMVTLPGQQQSTTLQNALDTIAELLGVINLNYTQQSQGLTKFSTDLNLQFNKFNTINEWLGQAGVQHQLPYYADQVGVYNLPPLPQAAEQLAKPATETV
ncbi:MAG TPA: lipase family protein [Chitinophaga sp.]|uniref:lipase family protein n=1 Tax=Chitinophaga sp. TaxID=1869181 RepID=UPI002C088C06|nr:lipase family protein [Chitinophaga sp.]HVI45383.1 lipase family protein [Chitinophaga sp.]